MRKKLSLVLGYLIAIPQLLCGLEIGKLYDVQKSTDLRGGPGLDHTKLVNQKASDILGKIHYLSVDDSTTVKVLQIQKSWVKIQVEQPDWLKDSHLGWIPASVIKDGDSTDKQDGWILHTCFVYSKKDITSKPFGYLAKPASVGVKDDGSGWLQLIHGPIRDTKTDKFLKTTVLTNAFIEKVNFTKEPPK